MIAALILAVGPAQSQARPLGLIDVTPPTVPTNLSEVGATETSASVIWTASFDDVGVAGYTVYLNGTIVGTTTGTDYAVTGLSCSTSYTVSVDAFDDADNHSDVTSTTAWAAPCSNGNPPGAPVGLAQTGASQTSVTLDWNAPSGKPPTGYGIYLDGIQIATTNFTGFTATGLSCGNSYSLAVDSFDSAGRRSPRASITASTSGCADTTPPVNSALPAVSGTTKVGSALTTSNGSWSNSPSSYSYQWQRCDSTGSACTAIAGATAATYTLASGDAGSTLRSQVTASNAGGSASATSTQSTAVTAAAPASTAANLGTGLPARMPQSSGTSSVYVSPTGNDSNPGTLAAPVQSFNQALTLATSGTIVFLRGGNYGRQYVFHHIYSASNPVTIQSFPGERAVVVGDATHLENAAHFDDVTGLRIQNVTFDATQNTTALKFTNPSHVEVNNVIIRDTDNGCNDQGVSVPSGSVPTCGWGIGLQVSGAPLSNRTNQLATDFQVWNSTFTNNGAHSTGLGGAIKHAHAVYLCSAGGDYTVDDGCNGFVVANNVVYDSPTGNAIQLGDSAHNGFVVNNTIDNTDTRAITGTSLCTLYSGAAMDPWGSFSWPNRNIVIANNTFTNNCANAVLATGDTAGGDVIRNNLGFHNGYACDWDGCMTQYNCNYTMDGHAICTLGSNLADADPRYVDRSGAFGAATKNFHLQAGSPALGLSDPAYTPPFDNDGNARPASPALGAYN